LPRRPYATRYVASAARIGYAFDPQSGRHAVAGDRTTSFHARADSLALIPAGCDVASASPRGGEYLDVELSGGLSVARTDAFSGRVSPDAIRAARALRRELLSPLPDPATIEVLVFDLRAGVLRPDPRPEERWMTPRRLTAIETMIEERLAERLTVADLAGALGLSPGFLIRAHRAATGRGLHERLIDRRVARARSFLSDTERTLADIAFACGFSSHAHMTETFRRRLGASPEAIRRSLT